MRRRAVVVRVELPARLRALPADDVYADWLRERREWAREHGIGALAMLRDAMFTRHNAARRCECAPCESWREGPGLVPFSFGERR